VYDTNENMFVKSSSIQVNSYRDNRLNHEIISQYYTEKPLVYMKVKRKLTKIKKKLNEN